MVSASTVACETGHPLTGTGDGCRWKRQDGEGRVKSTRRQTSQGDGRRDLLVQICEANFPKSGDTIDEKCSDPYFTVSVPFS